MAQLIGYTLGAMFDPMLIIICVAAGFLIKNYGLSVLVGCLVVIPLNLALISSLGNSPSTMFVIARPIAVTVWCGLFFWIGSNSRNKKKPTVWKFFMVALSILAVGLMAFHVFTRPTGDLSAQLRLTPAPGLEYEAISGLTPRSFVALVQHFAFCDIPMDTACYSSSNRDALPHALWGIIGQIPCTKQRNLVSEWNDGKFSIHHSVTNFDLTRLLGYHKGWDGDDSSDAEITQQKIKSYFYGRKVDVAEGHGHYIGNYGFSFDWIVVFDPKNKVVFSFIFNLQD